MQIGDTITIKENLISGEKYEGITFSPAMEKYKRKTYIIQDIDDDNLIYIKDLPWIFTKKMIKISKITENIQIGDIVEVIDKYYKRIFGEILEQSQTNRPNEWIIGTNNVNGHHKLNTKNWKYGWWAEAKNIKPINLIIKCSTQENLNEINKLLKTNFSESDWNDSNETMSIRRNYRLINSCSTGYSTTSHYTKNKKSYKNYTFITASQLLKHNPLNH